MNQKSSPIIIFCLIFLFFQVCSCGEEDPQQTHEIYVSNTASSSSQENGSEGFPFSTIRKAINSTPKILEKGSNITILVAPTSQPYMLDGHVNLRGKGSVWFTSWNTTKYCEPGSSCPKFPLLDMNGSLFVVGDCEKFKMSNFEVFANGGQMNMGSTNVTFENISFFNLTYSKMDTSSIQLSNVESLVMKNINVHTDAPRLFLRYLEFTTINPMIELINITHIRSSTQTQVSQDTRIPPLFEFKTLVHSKQKGNITINGITIKAEQMDDKIPVHPLLSVTEWKLVSLQNLRITDQSLNLQPLNRLIVLESCSSVIIEDFLVKNSKISGTSSLAFVSLKNITSLHLREIEIRNTTINWHHKIPFVFFNVEQTSTIYLEQHSLQENIFKGEVQIFKIEDPSVSQLSALKTSLRIDGIKFINNDNSLEQQVPSQFNYLDFQGVELEELTMRNIDYLSNKLTGKIFNFITKGLPTGDDVKAAKVLNIERMNISNNLEANDLMILMFSHTEETAQAQGASIPQIERYQIVFADLTIANNKFSRHKNGLWMYRVSLFQIRQTQFCLSSLDMNHNYFEDYNIFHFDQNPSTVLLTRSKVLHNTFKSTSLINAHSLSDLAYTTWESENRFITPPMPLYRISAIADVVFSDIQVISSTLCVLNNGFLLFYLNEITNSSLSNSKFLSSSFSPPPLPNEIKQYQRDLKVEDLVTRNLPPIWTLFDLSLTEAISFSPQTVYFYNVSRNAFYNISLSASPLIDFQGYTFNQSFIGITHNFFELINVADENLQNSPVITIDSFKALNFNKNEFKQVYVNAIVSSLLGQNSDFLHIENNHLKDSNFTSFITHKGSSIKSYKVLGNYFEKLNIGNSLFYLQADQTFEDPIIKGNRLLKLEFKEEDTRDDCIGIFCVIAKKAPGSSKFIFDQNELDDFTFRVGGQSKEKQKQTFFLYTQSFQTILIRNLKQNFIIASKAFSFLRFSKASSVTIQDSQMDLFLWGEFALLSTRNLLVENSHIKNINSESGLFTLLPRSDNSQQYVTFRDTTFEMCNVRNGVGAAILNTQSQADPLSLTLRVEDCQILYVSNGMAFHFSNTICKDCLIKGGSLNMGFEYPAGFPEEGAIIEVRNGAAGQLHIDGTKIQMLVKPAGPLVNIKESEMSVILNNVHQTLERRHELQLATLDSGTFHVVNCSFQGAEMERFPVIWVKRLDEHKKVEHNPQVKIESTTFSGMRFGGVSDSELDTVQGFFSPSFNYREYFGGSWRAKPLIYSSSPVSLSIINSTFQEFSHMPAIVIDAKKKFDNKTYAKMDYFIDIRDSNFTRLEHSVGPAVSVLPQDNNPNVRITGCLFQRNHASVGGSLFVFDSFLDISHSKFESSTASIAPAMFLGRVTKGAENWTNVTFDKNEASDGGDVRTEAVNFKISFVSENPQVFVSMEYDPTRDSYSFSNVTSRPFREGKLLFEFVDSEGQPTPDYAPERHTTLLIGSTVYPPKKHIPRHAHLSSFSIPLTELDLSDVTNSTVPLRFEYKSETIKKNHFLPLSMRACAPGEVQSSNCDPCPPTTFSLFPNQSCAKCPANAACPGLAEICPKNGFWNHPADPAEIIKCRQDGIDRCLNDEEKGCRNCATGYTGPVCEACNLESGYYESGYLKCGKCENPNKSLMISIGFSVLYFLYQIYSIYTIHEANARIGAGREDYLSQRKIERSYYIKSFLTYTQIMSLLYMSSTSLSSSFNFTQTGNPSSLIVYGTQCSMEAFGIKPLDFAVSQIYLLVSTPLIQLVIITFFLVLIKQISRNFPLKEVVSVSILYIILSYQPGMLTNLAMYLSCSTIKGLGYEFLTAHPSWQCDERFKGVAKFIGFPALVFWGVVIPLVIWIILITNRKKIQDNRLFSLFGALLSDVKKERYYWGVVVMGLKMTLALLAFGFKKNDELQIFVSLVIIWVYQSLVGILEPFLNTSFNNFERTNMNILMFNIVSTKYLLNEQNEDVVKKIFLTITVIVNGVFLLLILCKIISLTFLNITALVEKRILKREISRDSELYNSLNLKDL